MKCTLCGRVGRAVAGETCGALGVAVFTPKTEAQMAADILWFRLGLPSDDMTLPRCLGTMVKS